MIVADIALMFCVIILSIKLSDCVNRLDLAYEDSEEFDADIGNLKQRCEGHEELIEALSKSVRELNGVVEEAVKVKEETSDNKPDTKALIGGWMTDDGSTEIDASYIRTGMIDGKSVMNCELPYISESAREKIFEMLGVKVPEEELKLTAYSMDRALGRTVSGDVVWMDKRGHVNYGAYGD